MSRYERESIKNSEISGVGRVWKMDATKFEIWAKEGKSIEQKFQKELAFLLAIVS